MKELLIVTALIGNFQVTSYRSVPSQTDASPWVTSIGERVHSHGIAVSQNLLKRWGGPLDYGDTVYIDQIGFKVINDCMNERYVNRVDVWVATLDQEKAFHKKFKGHTLNIWVIKRGTNEAHKETSKNQRAATH